MFTDIFHCLDLNGDMLLSRQEFELFHIVSSGESLSDAMWNVMGGELKHKPVIGM